MKKRTPDKFWFPWWPDKWIFGSVRIECSPAERGIWVDLLSFASKDDGYIRANEETPYLLKQLAGILLIEEKELEDAIEKFIKLGKLKRTKEGTLYIIKWNKYQFSKRHKRRVEVSNGNPSLKDSKEHNIKEEDKIEDDRNRCPKTRTPSPQKRTLKIFFNFESEKWENIQKKDIERWGKTYSACDIEYELLSMADWLISNPEKKKSNYKSFISRWLRKEQDRGGTKKKEGKEGKLHPIAKDFLERKD